MKLTVAPLELPPVEDKLQGPTYESFKRSLVGLLFTQRTETFSDEASAEGPWPPLASTTLIRRMGKVSKNRRGAGAVKILQDTGALRQAFTQPGAAGQEIETEGDEVALINHVPYAAIQNYGGTISHPGTRDGFGRGIRIPPHAITIPARPIDQFTQSQSDEITEFTEAYLNG